MHRLILILILGTSSLPSWGHGDEDHSEMKKEIQPVASADNELKQKYTQINKLYIKTVKPIFKKSCFDCHGNTTNYPWYYKVPGVKQLIDSDIGVKEAPRLFKRLSFHKPRDTAKRFRCYW